MAPGTEPQPQQTVDSPLSARRKPFWEKRGWLETALVWLALLVFLSTLSFGFVYDDRLQILANPFIQSWRYLAHDFSAHIWTQTTKHPLMFYRPVFLTWLMWNYTLFKTHAWGWHLTTVLLHGMATLLVYRLGLRLLQRRWQAAVAGLLFAIHPVHVESVAWVSGVVDPLMSVFFLGAFLGYLHWRQRGAAGWLSLSLVLGFLAMLTKEPAVTLPAVVFAYAWIFAGDADTAASRSAGRWRTAGLHAAPYALLALLYLGLRMAVIRTASPVVASYHTIFLTLPGLLLFYLRLVVWPVGLSLFYDRQYVQHLTFGGFILPLLILALVAIALGLWLRRSAQARQGAFALAFALLVLSPALWVRYFPADDFVHDRYLYLPFAGFAFLLAIALGALGGRTAPRQIAPPRQVLVVAAAAITLIVGTLRLQTCWYNDLLLWYHCYKTAPHNQWVLNNLASSLGERGEYTSAIPLFQQVLQQNPLNSDAQGNLGYTYYRMGDLKSAEKYLGRAVQLDPSDAHWFLYLGLTHFKLGSVAEAETDLARSIALDPSAPGVHLALSFVLEQRGDVAGAVREAEAELAYHPGEPQARQQLEHLRGRR